MSREDQHFRLRLPADLREKVEAAAAKSRRSLTAEILARLEWSFTDSEPQAKEAVDYKKSHDDLVGDLVKDIQRMIDDKVAEALRNKIT